MAEVAMACTLNLGSSHHSWVSKNPTRGSLVGKSDSYLFLTLQHHCDSSRDDGNHPCCCTSLSQWGCSRDGVSGYISGSTPILRLRSPNSRVGKTTLPQRGTLYDTLQLHACNVTAPTVTDRWVPPQYPTPTNSVYVAPMAEAGGDGSIEKPFATITAAVNAVKGRPESTILLRSGTHYSGMTTITPDNQHLTIQNYNGEHAIVSGGIPIPATKQDWKPFKVEPRIRRLQTDTRLGGWTVYKDENNVYGRVKPKTSSGDIAFLGVFLGSLSDCIAAANSSTVGPFHSVTWHEKDFVNPAYAGNCFGVRGTEWHPSQEAAVWSARGPGSWVSVLTELELFVQNIQMAIQSCLVRMLLMCPRTRLVGSLMTRSGFPRTGVSGMRQKTSCPILQTGLV
eukprot:m.322480 g.322480  ORF g.322480 m.322480 type:complete len:395 (+) comp16454_c0_seq124:1404-2588(+)